MAFANSCDSFGINLLPKKLGQGLVVTDEFLILEEGLEAVLDAKKFFNAERHQVLTNIIREDELKIQEFEASKENKRLS